MRRENFQIAMGQNQIKRDQSLEASAYSDKELKAKGRNSTSSLRRQIEQINSKIALFM